MSVTTVGLFIALLVGGAPLYGATMGMSAKMTNMNGKMNIGSEYVVGGYNVIKDKFPTNQIEMSVRQILNTIENGHKISARSELLLNSISPETVAKLIQNFNRIMEYVSVEEANTVKLQAMKIIANVERITSAVPPETVIKLLDTLSNINAAKLNGLFDSISKLHEITMKINV